MELERRWEVNKNNIPNDSIKDIQHIEQVYSNLDPDVRIRCKNTKGKNNYNYTHTVKYFISNNNREELEQNISKDQYKRIFDYINKKPINKDRYLIDIGNNIIAELDDFTDVNKSVIEVEFKNISQMNNFIVPNWFGKEIKDRKMYDYKIFKFINDNKVIEFNDLEILLMNLS